MGAHIIDVFEAELLNRPGDLSLAYAVAAADFRLIRQGCNGRRRVQGGTSLVRLTENQSVAHFRNIDASLQHIEEPSAIRGLAVEHGTHDTVILQYKALVDALPRVSQNNLLAVIAL